MNDRAKPANRLVDVVLDDASIGRATPDVEHERAVAIFDLLEENSFAPANDGQGGPYRLTLSVAESRLVFSVARENGDPVAVHMLSLTPFKRVIKDYFLICESYYEAIRTASPVVASKSPCTRVARSLPSTRKSHEPLRLPWL